MRNSIRFLALATVTSACTAGHPQQSTTPIHYACEDAELTRTGDKLEVASSGQATDVRLGWADAAGSHYLAAVAASPDASTIEYVIPRDRHADATSRVYGGGHASTCSAHGGYTEAIALFAGGHSMADVAAKFGLSDSGEARSLVHAAMLAMTRRYYADR